MLWFRSSLSIIVKTQINDINTGLRVHNTINALLGHIILFVTETVNTNELVIFLYDIKETYKYLLVLDDLSEVSFVEPELGVVKGCLVCLSHHYLSTHFVVWLMREFGVEKSWTQLRNVSCEYLQIPGRCLCSVRLLCMPEHDDVLLLANNEAEEFVLYNKRDNTIDRTEGFTNSTCAFLSHNYVQSLVSPC